MWTSRFNRRIDSPAKRGQACCVFDGHRGSILAIRSAEFKGQWIKNPGSLMIMPVLDEQKTFAATRLSLILFYFQVLPGVDLRRASVIELDSGSLGSLAGCASVLLTWFVMLLFDRMYQNPGQPTMKNKLRGCTKFRSSHSACVVWWYMESKVLVWVESWEHLHAFAGMWTSCC